MFFKNLNLYRLPLTISGLSLETTLQPCGPHELQSIGWVAPTDSGELVHTVNNQRMIALGIEEKILPSSVIKQFANDKARIIEENECRRVGRKEMRELRESASIELLPRAFVKRRTTYAWLDFVNGWLVVDSSSPRKAEELLEHLRKSVEGFPVKLLRIAQSPSAAMTSWLSSEEAPDKFTIDQDLNLRSAENAEVRYIRNTLEGESVRDEIANGKVATKLALTWNDRISFVLTENLQLKRVSLLDILKEQNDGQAESAEELFDLDFTLMSGELAKMFSDLVMALGGEVSA